LSGECNRPELAQFVVREALDRIGANHVRVAVASQDVPTATYSLQCEAHPVTYSDNVRYNNGAEPIFEQADLFTEQTIPALRPIPIAPQTIPLRPGLPQ
jgi:hypothetical protein